MNWLSVMQSLAGITVFIFGMQMLEKSLQETVGRSFKKFLQASTRTWLAAILAGALVTALLQSSTVVSLLVLSFVGARILPMKGAMLLIMGSNLGTTLTGWMVATLGFELNIESLAYPILGLALLGFILPLPEKPRRLVFVLVGLAFLLVGLQWMKVSALTAMDTFNPASYQHFPRIFFVLLGFVITTLIQSSSATMAIALTALYSQMLPLDKAAALVIGSELGTSMKYLLATVGGIPEKKRVAWGNFLFNMLTIVLAYLLLLPILQFIQSRLGIRNPLYALTTFQSLINAISILVFLPVLNPFSRWLEKKFLQTGPAITQYLPAQPPLTVQPDETLVLATLETRHMFAHALQLLYEAFELEPPSGAPELSIKTRIWKWLSRQTGFDAGYEELKLLQREILAFLALSRQQESQQARIAGEISDTTREIIHAVKNIKDIRHNLREWKESANDELHDYYRQLQVRESDWLRRFSSVSGLPGSSDIMQTIDLWQHENRELFDRQNLLLTSNSGESHDAELSSQLNVEREIYSAHKALLKSLEILLRLETSDVSIQ